MAVVSVINAKRYPSPVRQPVGLSTGRHCPSALSLKGLCTAAWLGLRTVLLAWPSTITMATQIAVVNNWLNNIPPWVACHLWNYAGVHGYSIGYMHQLPYVGHGAFRIV